MSEFLVIVKRECETCQMVVPVLQHLNEVTALTVYTQDDPLFPASPQAIHDHDLSISWHQEIETVPTLIKLKDGVEVARTVGWSRTEWEQVTGIDGLGPDLPVMRPGCGSMSVDPNLVDELRVRFGGGVLQARQIELAELDDEFEMMFQRGWTDGLPVIPPTPERVLTMLTGTARSADEIVAVVPPDLVEITVEKVAIAAVMAGCRPEYMPWVLTALEAVCNDTFNMHGVLCTTMAVGPVIICSGPGTQAIGMNSGMNVLGQGNRANMTIGRAVQLVVRNFGGGRPGEVDRGTHGNPGKLSFCFAEASDSPFGSLAASRGLPEGVDAVTVFAGESPHTIVDQLSRTADSLANSIALSLQAMHHSKLALAFDAVLVIGPEHARVFTDDGWDRDRLITELRARTTRPGSEMIRGARGITEGVPEHLADQQIPKFGPEGLLITYAGGGAGLFTALIGGWANGTVGSTPVTREVRYEPSHS